MAGVDPAVGCKIYAAEEVELVMDAETAYLRVKPNRKRAMPILVQLPEGAATLLREAGDAQVERGKVWRRLQEVAADLRDEQSRNHALNQRISNQAQLLAEKDEAIAGYLDAIRAQDEEARALRERNRALFQFGSSAVTRLHQLRAAVLEALQPEDPHRLWMDLHAGLRQGLIEAGYQMREAMSPWSPVRWLGGGKALPAPFFLPHQELSHEEFLARATALQRVLAALARALEPAIHASLVSPEEHEAIAEGRE